MKSSSCVWFRSVSIFSQRAGIHAMPVIGGFLNIMYEMNGRQPFPKTFSPRLLAPNMKHLCCFRQTVCNSQKVYSAEKITESTLINCQAEKNLRSIFYRSYPITYRIYFGLTSFISQSYQNLTSLTSTWHILKLTYLFYNWSIHYTTTTIINRSPWDSDVIFETFCNLKQWKRFENILQFSLSPPYAILELGKTRVQDCLWSGGRVGYV